PARRAHRPARCEELAGGARSAGPAERRVWQDDRRGDPRPARLRAGQAPAPPREGGVRGAGTDGSADQIAGRGGGGGGGGAMRFLPLLWANLGRHKRRTFLTTASVALALFLFASLRTVVTTLRAAAEFGS